MRSLHCLPANTTGFSEHRLLHRGPERGRNQPQVSPEKRSQDWDRMAAMIASPDKNTFDAAETIHALMKQIKDDAVNLEHFRDIHQKIREMAKEELGMSDEYLRAITPRNMNETYDFLRRVRNRLGNNAPAVGVQPQFSPQQPNPSPVVSSGPGVPSSAPVSVASVGSPLVPRSTSNNTPLVPSQAPRATPNTGGDLDVFTDAEVADDTLIKEFVQIKAKLIHDFKNEIATEFNTRKGPLFDIAMESAKKKLTKINKKLTDTELTAEIEKGIPVLQQVVTLVGDCVNIQKNKKGEYRLKIDMPRSISSDPKFINLASNPHIIGFLQTEGIHILNSHGTLSLSTGWMTEVAMRNELAELSAELSAPHSLAPASSSPASSPASSALPPLSRTPSSSAASPSAAPAASSSTTPAPAARPARPPIIPAENYDVRGMNAARMLFNAELQNNFGDELRNTEIAVQKAKAVFDAQGKGTSQYIQARKTYIEALSKQIAVPYEVWDLTTVP